MVRAVSKGDKAQLSFGLVALRHGQSQAVDTLRTYLLNGRQVVAALAKHPAGCRGSNMGLRLDADSTVADAIYQIPPETFPGADTALSQAFTAATGHFASPNVSLAGMVVGRGDRFSSIGQYTAVQCGIVDPSAIYH
jgi:hypothetical protein